MTTPDLPQRPAPGPMEPRASDADRDRVIALLRDTYAAGQITLEEFAERAETALVAVTTRELQALTADLAAVPIPVLERVDAKPRRRATRWTLAILSSTRRRGRWRLGRETNALAFMGSCQLDLREVQLEAEPGLAAHVDIVAISIMGSIDIIVPEGVDVDIDGFAFMGSNDVRTKDAPVHGLPSITVRAFSLMGSVQVRNKRSPLTGPARAALEADRRQRHEERHHRHEDARRIRDEARRGRSDMRNVGRDLGRQIREDIRAAHRTGDFTGQGIRETIEQSIRMSLEALASSVQQRETTEIASHAAPDGTVTILFSDIEGFSTITELLGDRQAQDVLRSHNEVMRKNVKANDGYEVKSAGDSFMVAFSSGRRALRCAIAVQRELGELEGEHPILVRMGLHTGEVIREANDLFGKNVILAARIAGEATGGQILISSLVKELTESSGEFRFDPGREVELKGLSGAYRVHEVAWTG